jgi:hypothetical protein
MRLMIMHPLNGEIAQDDFKIQAPASNKQRPGSRKSRIEIHNSEGNLVGIVTKKELIKMLNLEQGFYYVREKDKNSRIINSGMMLL